MQTEKTSAAQSFAGWIVIVLPLAILLMLVIFPVISNFIISLNDVGIRFDRAKFIGFANYLDFFSSDQTLNIFFNTFAPLLFLRVILLVLAPFSLALLLMELKSGARITLSLLTTPLIAYSGATLVALIYSIYYSPQGLANAAVRAMGDKVIYFLDSPEYIPGIISNLLFNNGLALSLPLGLAFFLALMQGTRLGVEDEQSVYNRFWSRGWRLMLVFAIGVFGFSLAGLEGALPLSNPLVYQQTENLTIFSYRRGLVGFDLDYGAAASMFFILQLVITGLGLMLLLELPKSEIAIRYMPRIKQRLTAGAPINALRITALLLSGLAFLTIIYLVFITLGVPFFDAITVLLRSGFSGFVKFLQSRYLFSLAISLLSAFPAPFIAILLSATAGFVIGYLKPRGVKTLLIIIGSFIFLTPAVLIIPLYVLLRNLGLINNLTSLVFPFIISPLGIILYTWFFRGVRQDEESISAQSRPVNLGAFQARVIGSLSLFSLPIFVIYFLPVLNSVLIPLSTINQRELFPFSTTLLSFLQVQSATESVDAIEGMFSSMRSVCIQFSSLQYLLPFALLIVSLIVVLPRLALVVRRRNEPVAPLAPSVLEKLARKDAATRPAALAPVPASTLPHRWSWLAVFPLALFCLAVLIPYLLPGPPGVVLAFVFTVIGLLSAVALMLVFVFLIHNAVKRATNGAYPVTPAQAVLYHFIPFYGLWWMYKWAKGIAGFVHERNPKEFALPAVFVFMLFFSLGVFFILLFTFMFTLVLFWLLVFVALGATLPLGLSLYMAGKLKNVLKTADQS